MSTQRLQNVIDRCSETVPPLGYTRLNGLFRLRALANDQH
jgi:hypothetical protein